MKKLSKLTKVKNYGSDKEVMQKIHFIKRVRERLSFNLSDNGYDHLVSCIKNEKKCNFCEIEYLYNQSNSVKVYQLTFDHSVPVDAIFDNKRQTFVTILFQDEAIYISSYFNIFNTRVNLKHDLGYNTGWKIDGNDLLIPHEIVEYHNSQWEVVSDGILKGKKFKIDNCELQEVM